MRQNQEIIDPTDLKKYRTEFPNLYDDADLTVYEFRLLIHYKRVGTCWEGIRKTAQKCHMSQDSVIKARRQLKKKKWISVAWNQPTDTYRITLRDVWMKNFTTYNGGGARVASRGARVASRGARVTSRGARNIEHKKQHIKKEPLKKEPLKKQQQQPRDGNARKSKPVAVAVSKSKSRNPGLIQHYAERMNAHLGIDLSVACQLATLSHITDAYLRTWENFAEYNAGEAYRTNHDETAAPKIQFLGPGFYVKHIRAGENAPWSPPTKGDTTQ
ncbi:MAG: hypothetical protein HY868_16750 [Chloroflexi bacterium]|nr:hypothetical protein [Chloroflexota bacterium]